MFPLKPRTRRNKSGHQAVQNILDSGLPLLEPFLWKTNPWGSNQSRETWLHLGCGNNVLKGFTNIDFIADKAGVIIWDLLNAWPAALHGRVEGVFSEELMEHFYYSEQLYILANINLALKERRICRVIMPSLAKLDSVYHDYLPGPDRYFYKNYGWLTGADALNCGLRFSGHRWLHDADSFRIQAEACGYEVRPTKCAESAEPRFCDINLREEAGSLSFAHDLIKTKPARKVNIGLTETQGVKVLEQLDNGMSLCETTSANACLVYDLPEPVRMNQITLLVVRASNLSVPREHSVHAVILNGAKSKRHAFDETLKSKRSLNAMSFCEIMRFSHQDESLWRVEFTAGLTPGEYFIGGHLELYVLKGSIPNLLETPETERKHDRKDSGTAPE